MFYYKCILFHIYKCLLLSILDSVYVSFFSILAVSHYSFIIEYQLTTMIFFVFWENRTYKKTSNSAAFELASLPNQGTFLTMKSRTEPPDPAKWFYMHFIDLCIVFLSG